MTRKSLINQLELAYAPLTAYDFSIVKNDKMIERAVEKASLYVLGQRPVITFEQVVPDMESYNLLFEIHQQGNEHVLKCKMPLIQKIVGSKDEDTIAVAFNYLNSSIPQTSLPFNQIRGFSLCQELPDERKFLIWFSPEKLLQNWWTGSVECEIEGDYTHFLKYNVHYVGKATKQSILKRLTGHSTFQDILSLESPVTKMQLPANEIVILCFEFQDNLQIQSFGPESDIDEMVSAFKGDNYPDQERVFLDAEKALIKAMEPSYNKQLFTNYPISKDGLYNEKYDSISYTFMDPITLVYQGGKITGGLSTFGGDGIAVFDNKTFKLIKHE